MHLLMYLYVHTGTAYDFRTYSHTTWLSLDHGSSRLRRRRPTWSGSSPYRAYSKRGIRPNCGRQGTSGIPRFPNILNSILTVERILPFALRSLRTSVSPRSSGLPAVRGRGYPHGCGSSASSRSVVKGLPVAAVRRSASVLDRTCLPADAS